MQNILDIEKREIRNATTNQIYRAERDFLKSRFFTWLKPLKCNHLEVSASDVNSLIKADMIARSQRLLGKNVLFPVAFNNLDLKAINASQRLSIPLIDFLDDSLTRYQETVDRLEISYNPEKSLQFAKEDYHSFIQMVFTRLYNKGLIYRKNDLLVYDDDKIYQYHEYKEVNGQFYNEDNKLLSVRKSNLYVLNINSIKDNLSQDLKSMKDSVLKGLGYQNGIEICFKLSNGNALTIDLLKPECIFGISFIVINPKYLDITPYVDLNEYSDNQEGMIYSGVDLINHFSGVNVPLFISTYFNEAIHVGIPSDDEKDEMLATQYDLPYYPIYDYLSDKKILVNSRFLNGYKTKEAREKMIDICLKNHEATYFEGFINDEIIISSHLDFGMPIPLTNEFKTLEGTVTYDLKYETKVMNDISVDKMVVKEFMNPLFLEMFAVHASMIKDIAGFDFDDNYSDKVDVVIASNANIHRIGYYLLGEKLLKLIGFKQELKLGKIKVIDDCKISNLDFILNNYGSTILRLSLLITDGEINEKALNEAKNIISIITEVCAYPQNNNGLDLEFIELKNSLKEAVRFYNFKEFFEKMYEYIKKVRKVKMIPYAQLKALIIYLSVITPAFAEELKKNYLRIQTPLIYLTFPE